MITLKCPVCGEEVSLYDGDIEIWSIGERKVTMHHVSVKCDGKWAYKRNVK